MSIFNHHSAVAFLPELHLITRGMLTSPDRVFSDVGEFQGLLHKIGNPERAKHLGIDQAIERLHSQGVLSFKSLFLELIRTNCENQNKTIGGEKDAVNHHIGFLADHFPNSKIIHIVRDPRDAIPSGMKTDWGKATSLMRYISRYRKAMKLAFNHSEKAIAVKYEDLLQEPKPTVTQLCEGVGIPYEAQMLRYYESSEQIVASDERAWKENVFKPILSTNFNKWKDDLPRKTLLLIELFTHKEMHRLGYKTHYNKFAISLLGIPLKAAMDLANFIKNQIKR